MKTDEDILNEKNEQKALNEQNIISAINKLESGRTIYNGDNYFVAYLKRGARYYTFTNDDENEKLTTLENIKKHIKEYTLETNHYFF